MTYRQAFDPLGRPRPLPTLHKPKISWVHRAIRWASCAVIAVCAFILLWVR